MTPFRQTRPALCSGLTLRFFPATLFLPRAGRFNFPEPFINIKNKVAFYRAFFASPPPAQCVLSARPLCQRVYPRLKHHSSGSTVSKYSSSTDFSRRLSLIPPSRAFFFFLYCENVAHRTLVPQLLALNSARCSNARALVISKA